MNLDREISDHLEWIDAIASLLGEEEITEARLQAISSHDNCALGKWLESDAAAELKASAEFDRLTESHEIFHQLAGKLIAALQQGNETEALALQQQFIAMSQQVISSLRALQQGA